MKLRKIADSRLTAVLVGGVAIAVIGAGAGYAAGEIRSRDIKNDTIRSADIKNGTIRSADINDGAIALADLKAATIRRLQGQDGATGPAGPAGPRGPSNVVPVTNLNGLWTARADDLAGIALTGDGVQFGPFADGGSCTPGIGVARLDFSGLNGQPLRALTNLVYRAQYISDNDNNGVGTPSMRVFFDDPTTPVADRLTFSANTQFTQTSDPSGVNLDLGQGSVHEWIVTSGTVRLNDDAGERFREEDLFKTFQTQFANLPITNINILNGCQNGTNLRSIVREVQINGIHYEFGAN